MPTTTTWLQVELCRENMPFLVPLWLWHQSYQVPMSKWPVPRAPGLNLEWAVAWGWDLKGDASRRSWQWRSSTRTRASHGKARLNEDNCDLKWMDWAKLHVWLHEFDMFKDCINHFYSWPCMLPLPHAHWKNIGVNALAFKAWTWHDHGGFQGLSMTCMHMSHEYMSHDLYKWLLS